jgi:signal transduction histidine kinase
MINILKNIIQKLSSEMNNDDKNIHDLIETIVYDSDTFKAAYYFIFDPFIPKFACEDVFLKGDDDDIVSKSIKDQINNFIKEKGTEDICIHKELENGVGIYCYVAQKFFRNSDDDNIFIIDNYEKFISEHELAKYNCNIGEDIINPKSIYFIPIYINDNKPILQSMIVLYSDNDKVLSKSELKTLSSFLSEILTLRINRIADKALLSLVNRLSEIDGSNTFDEELGKTLNAFNKLFNEQIFENVPHSKLKYASFWTVNQTDKSDMFLAKEKRKNYGETDNLNEGIQYNDILLIDSDTVADGQHLYYNYIIESLGKMQSDVEFHEFVSPVELGSVGDKFRNHNSFISKNGLCADDIIVMFPVASHTSIAYRGEKENSRFLNLMVLVFDKSTYRHYYSSEFLEMVSHKIYENVSILSRKQRRLLRDELHNDLHSLITKPDTFFRKASDAISVALYCEAVAIYTVNDYDTLELRSPKNTRYNLPEQIESNSKDFDYSPFGEFFAQKIYDYFDGFNNNETRILFVNNRDSFRDRIEDNSVIYSLLLFPIKAKDDKIAGFMFCINNIRNVINNESNYSSFCYHDHDIAEIGAELVLLFTKMLNHSESQGKLLKKLSHEIPGLTKVIIDNAKGIKEQVVEYRYGATTYYKKFDRHSENLLNLINSSSHIIRIYSHYAITSGGLDKNDTQRFKIKYELASLFHILLSEANDLGVSFYYTLYKDITFYSPAIVAHRFFPMVLINVVRNAIHYAHFGTKVHLFVKEKSGKFTFLVRNIGIPVYEEDKDKIFQKAYRTKEAQAKYFKGTGFGLSFVQEIVDACGGSIKIIAENDFCQKNIMGINSINNLLSAESSFRGTLYNKFVKVSETKRQEWDDYLRLSHDENKYLKYSDDDMTTDEVSLILNYYYDKYKKYRDLQLYSKTKEGELESERLSITRGFIKEKINGGETMTNIIEKYLDIPSCLITFIIEI